MPEEFEEKDVLYYLEHPEEVDPEKMRRFLYRMLSLGQVDHDSSSESCDGLDADQVYFAKFLKSIREKK
ncbi:MAG: hypothetical protein FWD61_16610 [Phycisphaerales bacterium]|nr:hypothetical protein [Phycisphaerales bacterium]